MPNSREIGLEIKRVSNLIRRDIERNMKKKETVPESGIHGWAIDYFYENKDKDIFQKDFEKKFQIRRSTASNMLKLMEKNGYIKRVSVKSDARLKKIVLTEKAVKMHCIIAADIKRIEDKMRNGISEEELEIFFAVTEKIKSNLETKGERND